MLDSDAVGVVLLIIGIILLFMLVGYIIWLTITALNALITIGDEMKELNDNIKKWQS